MLPTKRSGDDREPYNAEEFERFRESKVGRRIAEMVRPHCNQCGTRMLPENPMVPTWRCPNCGREIPRV